MKLYISILFIFMSAIFCEAQNGFYGKRFSVAGSILLNRPSTIEFKNIKPTVDLGLRYVTGPRGQLIVNYSMGKVDFLKNVNFVLPNVPSTDNSFSETIFPVQKVQQIYLEQRLFRKNSYAPIGSYVGFGIGFHQYELLGNSFNARHNGLVYDIPIEQSIKTDFFLNEFHISSGKVIPINKRLLLDIHLKFSGIFLRESVLSSLRPIDNITTRPKVFIEFNDEEFVYKIADASYDNFAENIEQEAINYQRNIPRLLISIQYLLY